MSVNKALVDKLLTNVSQAYYPKGYISEAILPVLSVVQQSGKIGKMGSQHLRIENTVMGGKAGARRIEVRQYASDSYFIEPHGLEELISPEEYKNVEQPFDIEKDVTVGLTTALWLGKEKALADSLTSTSVITQNTTLSGTSQWNDYTNSDPIGVSIVAKNTIRAACGMAPDTAYCDWSVAEMLRYHPKILRNLGFADSRAGQLSNDDLAKALGVRRLLVADVMYNSAKEGQTDALASVWGKHFGFAVAPDTAAKYQLSLGYRVQFAGEGARQVFKANGPTNLPGSTSVVVKDSYDLALTQVKCAYLIKDAIA